MPFTALPSERRGYFITFEGGEGSGKSTQIKLLAEALAARGLEPLVTREPGGTPLAERIRPLLVEPSPDPQEEWDPLAETLLFFAARAQHWRSAIAPALQAGRWVLCDRFLDSTLAYQGLAKGLGITYLQDLQRMILGDEITPDRTFLLDIEPRAGLERAAARQRSVQSLHLQAEDRFESLEMKFHEKLREGFLALALAEPGRFKTLDAAIEPQMLHAQVWRSLQEEAPCINFSLT